MLDRYGREYFVVSRNLGTADEPIWQPIELVSGDRQIEKQMKRQFGTRRFKRMRREFLRQQRAKRDSGNR